MSVSARASEPSMEEILASIRRIIADEVSPEPATPPAPAASRPTSASARSIPPREMPARETPVRETFVRPVPAQTPPRDMAARDAAPFHGTPNGRVTSVGREPVNGSATSTRSGFAAATPLRPRPEAPVLPVASATTRPVPPARSVGPAPLPPVSSGARPATESPYSYGSTVPGFRSAAAAPSYAPAGRVPAADPFAPRPRSAPGLASARALPAEEPETAPVPEATGSAEACHAPACRAQARHFQAAGRRRSRCAAGERAARSRSGRAGGAGGTGRLRADGEGADRAACRRSSGNVECDVRRHGAGPCSGDRGHAASGDEGTGQRRTGRAGNSQRCGH